MNLRHLLASVCAFVSVGHAADVGGDLLRLKNAYTTIGKEAGAVFASSVTQYSADEAVDGIVAAAVLRQQGAFSEGAYEAVQAALRYRVAGLAMSLEQAPGAEFRRTPGGTGVVLVDGQGVKYQQVDIKYTFDQWASSRTTTLTPRLGGYTALLENIPTAGRIEYVLHFFGADGRDYWVNNGRDQGEFGGPLALNYRFELAALSVPPAQPSRPAFVQLMRKFAGSGSDEGAVVTNLEFSLLVAMMTWEGGRGVHARETIDAIDGELSAMKREGVVFKAGVADNMRSFLTSQRDLFHRATFFPATWTRAEDGFLTVSAKTSGAASGAVFSVWHYSTDGWHTTHTVTCRPVNDPTIHDCKLGYIPPGTLLTFAVQQHFADGTNFWHRVIGRDGYLNFFMPIPN